MVRQELDFTAEAVTAGEIGGLFETDPTIRVLAIVESLSRPTVVVMEFIDGAPLGDTAALDAAGVDRSRLATTVIQANLTMVLGSTRIHADPHPGNFLAFPEGRLAISDFGATGTADPLTPAELLELVAALAGGDPDGLSSGVLGITTATRPVDHDLLNGQLHALLGPLTAAPLHSLRLGRLLEDVLSILRAHGLRVNATLAPLLKAVIETESTAQELDPEIRLANALIPFQMTRHTDHRSVARPEQAA
jgi:ubiquinone biosynthesis protein